MCDTLVCFKDNDTSFFAKNSDREPEERQLVYLSSSPVEELEKWPYEIELEKYQRQFECLKGVFSEYKHPYKAFISRPDWMWGAEMGVNEYGLAVGNEAVFSRERVPDDGLLGMDILRLALHNCREAEEAATFITGLIEDYGQGGDGGFKSTLKYFNSFLIKDFKQAYIVETSDKSWAVREVKSRAAISNCYSVRNDYDSSNLMEEGIDFKNRFENRLMSFFSRGGKRRKYILEELKKSPDLAGIFKIMRSHGGQKRIKKGMGSVCMHPGFFIKNATTSSMVVEYLKKDFIVWFTGAPFPCVSLYRPFVFGTDRAHEIAQLSAEVLKNSERWRNFSELMVNNYKLFHGKIRQKRDRLEAEFRKNILESNNTADTVNEILCCAEEFREENQKLIYKN